jgi:hypothetical protein
MQSTSRWTSKPSTETSGGAGAPLPNKKIRAQKNSPGKPGEC